MTEQDFANMSDEEFAAYESSHQADEVEMETVDGPETMEEDVTVEPEEETTGELDDSQVEDEDELTEVDEDTDPAETEVTEDDTTEDTQETSDEAEVEVEENTQTSVEGYDYKAGFEAVMAPIKANGRDIQIKSAEDARTLIQKGLNYDEKMVAIKPVRLAGKALERAGIIKDGIIDELALNRMIDFNNGDVEVVKERLKELNINPLDLDLDATNYQAQDHIPDEHSVAIEDIQRELDMRGSTEQVVTALDSMDEGSKGFFSENPEALLGLEQDITSGVFDEIYGNVAYERKMGRLAGKTDMEAYIEFAQARGAAMEQQVDSKPEVKAAPAKPRKVVNTNKRARAAGTKPSVGTSAEVVNPFDLSDEEFEKQFGTAQATR